MPQAEIIPCDYGEVPLEMLVGTGAFDFNSVATSAAWIQELEKKHDEHEHEHHHHEHHHHDHDHEHHHHHEHGEHCTCGCCHHHHDHEHGHGDEYGIGTYVFFSRKPFDISLFDEFVARHWPKNVIRAKGLCYFANEDHICYLFEQAGRQFELKNCGQWYATMPEDELKTFLARNPKLLDEWDEQVGDRVQKLVFIGQHLDRHALHEQLEKCLVDA